MAVENSSQTVLLCNYEYPDVTSNAGGGGRITKLLYEGLQDAEIDALVATDDSDGHYLTYPLRRLPKDYQTIRGSDPDIVHGHFSLPTSLGLRELTPNGTPLVISVMGADIYDPTRFNVIRPVADRLNRHILKSADAVIAPSTDMANRVERKYGVETPVIHYGIEPDRWTWRHRETPDQPTILSVCRLVERKQLPLAISAVERWRNETGVDATYRIVGTGELKPDLEAKAETRDWLTIVGYADNLQAEFDDADMFYLPSAHEAFGVVFLEALACGLPVVSTNIGGQTDIVSRDVGELAPSEIEEQTAALKRLYNNYRDTQDATEGYVETHFSSEQMVADYRDVYAEVLQ